MRRMRFEFRKRSTRNKKAPGKVDDLCYSFECNRRMNYKRDELNTARIMEGKLSA
jgi:hypothetical protein